MKSHIDKCKNHVIMRAKERLNLHLNNFDCDYLTKMIQDGECEHIVGKKGVFAVKFKNRIFKVCYNKKIHYVTTVYEIS